ncbi:MAG: hypothetical protein LIP00_04755 [Parabacteroides sp.]|nr:hypothetical protein [Parabacteroides sp.]
METKFQISEVFATSWKAVKSQIWVLVGLFVGYAILSMIISSFTTPPTPVNPYDVNWGRIVIVNLISLIVGGLFMLGYLKNLFQTLDGIEPQFSAYGQQARKIVTYIVMALLYSLILMVGLIFFIIPGIYFAIRLQFAPAFIVEENMGVIDSLKMSWNITKGNIGQLFLLWLAMTGICILGLIVLIIGIFVAVPLIYMMYCYTFRKLYPNPLALQNEEEAAGSYAQ